MNHGTWPAVARRRRDVLALLSEEQRRLWKVATIARALGTARYTTTRDLDALAADGKVAAH